MSISFSLRPATLADVPALWAVIHRSAHTLSGGYYTPEQRDAAIQYVFGVDTALIADGTYFVAESKGTSNGTSESGQGPREICGCGGWSARRTLYGGDQHKAEHDPPLDPATDAARIRAFFVAPEFARQGIGGSILQACARAAFAAGFSRLELMATLPGVPLYRAFGFSVIENVVERAANGVDIPFVRMGRPLTAPRL